MHLTYHIGQHDGGWPYRLNDVWSETYPSHVAAREAAHRAARRQQLEGRNAEILFQSEAARGIGNMSKQAIAPRSMLLTSSTGE